jgi:6-phosphogluconolactonase
MMRAPMPARESAPQGFRARQTLAVRTGHRLLTGLAGALLAMACSATPPASMPRQSGGTSGGGSNSAGNSGNASGGTSGTGGVVSGTGGNNPGGAAGNGGSGPSGGGGSTSTMGTGGSGADARRDDGGTDSASPSPTTDGPAPTRAFVYASGYSAPITIFAFDLATGKLTPSGMATTGTGGEPTSLAFAPNKKFLYAGDEQKSAAMSRVIAFSINQTTGALQEINREGTRGATLAHVEVHPSGKWVLAANYDTNNVTVFAVKDDGGLSPAMPPVPACGQAHFILFDSTGKFLFVPCVASNQIAMYRFADGVLTPNEPAMIAASGGPRHLAFSPDERFVYSMAQSTSTVSQFSYDKATGKLTAVQTVPTAMGAGTGGHVALHPSGKFLYASNRRGPGLTVFSVDATSGRLTRVGDQAEMLSAPWWFSLDPAGQFLIVPNSGTSNVLVHKVDQTTGTLQPLGPAQSVAMRPTYAGILALP